MNSSLLAARFCVRFVPLLLVLALTACGGSSKSQKAATDEDPKAVKTAYGISFHVPEGWKIDNVVSPNQATPAVIDQRIASGEQLQLVSISRPANTPEGKNGVAAIFLVDSDRDVFPRADLREATPEDLQRVAQNFLKHNHEQARQSKTESNLLSWELTKGDRQGKMTLISRGEAKRPGGRLELYNISIYLDNGKGIGIKTLTDPDAPGNAEQLREFVDSIRFTQ